MAEKNYGKMLGLIIITLTTLTSEATISSKDSILNEVVPEIVENGEIVFSHPENNPAPNNDPSKPKSLMTPVENFGGVYCDPCNTYIKSGKDIMLHLMEKHETYVHRAICPVCSSRHAYASKLHRHLIKYTKVKEYACEYCKKSFKMFDTVTKHKRAHALRRIPGNTYTFKECYKMQAKRAKELLNEEEERLKKRIRKDRDGRSFPPEPSAGNNFLKNGQGSENQNGDDGEENQNGQNPKVFPRCGEGDPVKNHRVERNSENDPSFRLLSQNIKGRTFIPKTN